MRKKLNIHTIPFLILSALSASYVLSFSSSAFHHQFSIVTTPEFRQNVQRKIGVLSLVKNSNNNINNNNNRRKRHTIPSSRLQQSCLQDTDITASGGESDFIPAPTRSRTAPGQKKSDMLNMICDERREFEMNLGKAVDTLRKDYPTLLTEAPDFSIFDENIEAVDPSKFTIHGLKNYKTSFVVVRSLVNFFYCPDASGLTFRLVFDWARSSIRVSWNAVLIPKLGGESAKLHVDGISVYEVDRASGLITQHRIEHLLLNNNPIKAPKGVFYALSNQVSGNQEVPVLGGYNIAGGDFFSQNDDDFGVRNVFYSSADTDADAFERKNRSRKNFGLPPLTMEEFIEIQAEIKKIDMKQEKKKSQLMEAAAQKAEEERKEEKRNRFGKMFKKAMGQNCETNFDCERPEVCCDLIVTKVCCSSGMRVFDGIRQDQRIPKRVTADYPRGGPDGMDDFY